MGVSTRTTPPIEGLYIFPDALPAAIAKHAIEGIAGESWFRTGKARDQVMLFGRAPDIPIASRAKSCRIPGASFQTTSTTLPGHLLQILDGTSRLLRPVLPPSTWTTVFAQDLARQIIVNLYEPGQGISLHVDLPHRYADGVLGVSLTGSASMIFRRPTTSTSANESSDELSLQGPHSPGSSASSSLDSLFDNDEVAEEPSSGTCSDQDAHETYEVFLPPRSIYVLTGPARWDYSHGIIPRTEDIVESANGSGRTETILRDTRLSVTFRWMWPGAEVVGRG